MTDTRRVCDLSAAELLDAAWQRCAELGWTKGGWNLDAYVVDGHTRTVRAHLANGRKASISRRQLASPNEFDSAA